MTNHLIFAIFVVVLGATVHSAVIPTESNTDLPGKPGMPVLDRPARSLDKRPFCNAFTGCGRKRSGLNVERMPRGFPRESFNSQENESANNIFDFNSEPAVADIVQQIMSEAKVWDAIQAANRELKKQSGMGHNSDFPAFSAQ